MYIRMYIHTYIHTYIHKLHLNTNLIVAKKAETNTYLNVTMTCTHAYINFT